MPAQPEEAQNLGRSYAKLVGAQAWDGDEPAPISSDSSVAAGEEVPPSPLRIIEALLFVAGAPLTARRAGEIVRGLNEDQFLEAIDALNRAYRSQNRPYAVVAQQNGYLLTLRTKYRGLVEKLHAGPREARLSTAAIEVLALVAYRQPATKAEIDTLRGAESASLLRQLVRRGLIQVVYRADANQREVSYGTTPRFLQIFGLGSLDDLPRTQDVQGA